MKYTLLLLSFAVYFPILFGQKIPSIDLLSARVAIAKNEITKDSIYSQAVDFSHNIQSVYYDPFHRIYIVAFEYSNSDNETYEDYILKAYDEKFQKIYWQRKIKEKDLSTRCYDSIALLPSRKDRCEAICIPTGNALWTLPSKFFVNFNESKIGLTYENDISKEQKGVCAYRYAEENPIWCNSRIEISNSQYNAVQFVKDSIFIFYRNDSICGLNFYTGFAWSIASKLYEQSNNTYFFIYSGVLGYALFELLRPSVQLNTHSNILKEDNYFLIADNSHISKIGYDGTLYWKTKYSKQFDASHSTLIKVHDKYLVYNQQFLKDKKARKFLDYGQMMLVNANGSIDKDINLKSLKELAALNKEDITMSHFIDESYFHIIAKNHVFRLSLDNLELVEHKIVPELASKNWEYVSHKNLYVISSKNQILSTVDSSIYLVDPHGSVIKASKDYSEISDIGRNKIVYSFYSDDKIRVFKNIADEETYIFDNQDHFIFKLRLLHQIIDNSEQYTFVLRNSIVPLVKKELGF